MIPTVVRDWWGFSSRDQPLGAVTCWCSDAGTLLAAPTVHTRTRRWSGMWRRPVDEVFECQLTDDERIVGRVTLFRIIDEDGGMRDEVHTDDGEGERLDLPTAVGMLAIAQHTMLCDGEP